MGRFFTRVDGMKEYSKFLKLNPIWGFTCLDKTPYIEKCPANISLLKIRLVTVRNNFVKSELF
jgi:hypothetical protein